MFNQGITTCTPTRVQAASTFTFLGGHAEVSANRAAASRVPTLHTFFLLRPGLHLAFFSGLGLQTLSFFFVFPGLHFFFLRPTLSFFFYFRAYIHFLGQPALFFFFSSPS
jgi:hypothetical protein